MLALPAPAGEVRLSGASRYAGFVQRSSDPTVHRTLEPMGSVFEASVSFAPETASEFAWSGATAPLPDEVEELFAEYWASVPKDVSSDPSKLADYVKGRSGFEYSVDAPAKSLKSFLYEEKRGHCEYFATVLALTLRHFGYPATVVNGYYS